MRNLWGKWSDHLPFLSKQKLLLSLWNIHCHLKWICMLLIIKHAKPWCLHVIFHLRDNRRPVRRAASHHETHISEGSATHQVENLRLVHFHSNQVMKYWPIVHISAGFCSAAGIITVEDVRGVKGESVTFTTSPEPSAESFLALTRSFNRTTNIITSTSTDVVGKGYESRIALNKHTGSLVLTNLTEEDSGEYELIIFPYGGRQLHLRCWVSKIYKTNNNNAVTSEGWFLT